MMNMGLWVMHSGFAFLSFFLQNDTNETSARESIYQLNQLEVYVDQQPIGGFRGPAGTLMIGHVERKVFTEWDEEDLHTLADLIRRILAVREENRIENTFIFGRQDGLSQFKLSLIPYPSCSWFEKIQGLVHAIFGPPSLNQQQTEEIAAFYQRELAKDQNPSPKESGEENCQNNDPFCNPQVINRQKIADIPIENKLYHLLHDSRPKGSTHEDPHLLIVPERNSGHAYGSKIPVQQLFHIMKIAQKAISIFQSQNYPTLIFEQRIGKGIQGVQHIHAHAIGISSFPETLFEKLRVCFRQLFPFALSPSDLDMQIERYEKCNWI